MEKWQKMEQTHREAQNVAFAYYARCKDNPKSERCAQLEAAVEAFRQQAITNLVKQETDHHLPIEYYQRRDHMDESSGWYGTRSKKDEKQPCRCR